HEHPHHGDRGGDVRSHRHRLPRQDRGAGHHGGAQAADLVGGDEPRGPLPQADRRASDPAARHRLRRVTTAARTQPSLWTVLTPKWRGVLTRLQQERTGSRAKFVLLALTGVGFWTAVFGIAYRVLRYIREVQEIGNLLAGKVLSVILLAFLSILLLSNVITALSTFFLAKDLDLLVAAPIGWLRLYLAKLGETMVHSSWMVGLLTLPILTAYGTVF